MLESPIVVRAVRARTIIWLFVLAAVAARYVGRSDGDWEEIFDATGLLFGVHGPIHHLPGGLHLYASYPEFQFGPLALIAAVPLWAAGWSARWLAAVAMLGIGWASLVLIDRAASGTGSAGTDVGAARPARVEPAELGRLVGGVVAAVAWVPLAARYLHIDDALAVLAIVGAVVAIRCERGVLAGLLVGAAIGCKPWAAPMMPMLAGLPRTQWRRAGAAAVAATAAVWLPFLIAAPSMVRAGSPQVDVSDASVLRLFGVPGGIGPGWVRPVQLVVAGMCATVAATRGRWTGVALVVLAVRILVDPGTFEYYTSALVVAALVWDTVARSSAVPVATVCAALALDLAEVVVASATARAVLRLGAVLGLVGWVTCAPIRRPRPIDCR
ncbi:MAG: hypothetical protein V9E99_04615 [Microthrixaceae bacterium]